MMLGRAWLLHTTRRTSATVWRRAGPLAALVRPSTGLALVACGCAALVASDGLPNLVALPRAHDPPLALLLLLALLVGFVCAIAGLARTSPRWLARSARWLVYPVLLWTLVASAQSIGLLGTELRITPTQWPPRYSSDAMYYDHYGALLILRGENPYAGDQLASAMAYFHIHGYTPIARGRFSDPRHSPTIPELDAAMSAYLAHPEQPPPEVDPRTFHSYPVGAVLVDLPSVWAGLPSAGFAQLLLFLMLGAALVALAPAEARLVVALLLLCNLDGIHRIANGDFDIWWVALLVAAWGLRGRRITSSVLLGAACTIKQTVWFAAPFYLLWVWRERGPAEALRRLGIALGAFTLINLPWIVMSPRAWLASLTLPMSLPLLPDGTGLIGLSLAGALPLFPSWVYAALELALLAGALLWYWRMAPRVPLAGLVLPLLPLVAAWRGSERYFLPLTILTVAAYVLMAREMKSERAGAAAVGPPLARDDIRVAQVREE